MTVLISEEEREYRLLELERWAGSQQLAGELRLSATGENLLAREARKRAEDARAEADAAAAECPAATWAEEAEVRTAEAEAAQAKEAAARARIAEIESRIAELELAERTATRTRLHSHAAHVWGASAAASTPPPRVISLVGKTPDSVRTIGESRVISQQSTSPAERAALNRLL